MHTHSIVQPRRIVSYLVRRSPKGAARQWRGGGEGRGRGEKQTKPESTVKSQSSEKLIFRSGDFSATATWPSTWFPRSWLALVLSSVSLFIGCSWSPCWSPRWLWSKHFAPTLQFCRGSWQLYAQLIANFPRIFHSIWTKSLFYDQFSKISQNIFVFSAETNILTILANEWEEE